MTVWHLSESDVVNMVPADSAVEIVMSTHRQLHFGPTLHTLFAASMSAWRVHWFTCMCALVGGTLEAKQAYWMNSMCTLLHKGNNACAKPILHNSLAMITSCPPPQKKGESYLHRDSLK